MGACYDIKLKIKVKDEASVIKVLQERIKRNTEYRGVNYSLEKFAEEGVGTETLEDLLKIFLAGFNSNSYDYKKKKKGTIHIRNRFNASYGWESEMMGMFADIVPFLKDGSKFYICPDNCYDLMIVENGKYKQVH